MDMLCGDIYHFLFCSSMHTTFPHFYNNINLLIHTRITLTTYGFTLQSPQQSDCYAFGKINAAIPAIINIGNAMYINPPAASPINIKGRSTIVTKNFEIPHAALIPKNNNLPNTHIIQIVNKNDNIFLPPLCQCAYLFLLICRFQYWFMLYSFCCIHPDTSFLPTYPCRFCMFSV